MAAFARSFRLAMPHLVPFHWELEFPEVFDRANPGFDAIVGNPPFAGKNTIIKGTRAGYLEWLKEVHPNAHGNADLVSHFFRRSFDLLRNDGVFGLIATNTIGQGDTRDTGLAAILGQGGAIIRATRRLKWLGEAAVVVSVVHVAKRAPDAAGVVRTAVLDGRSVRRISAYLVAGDLDHAPARLAANARKAFVGSYVLGMGFTFDDAAAAKGEAESLETMRALIAKDARNAERIFPYIGGEEVNTSPIHAHHRYVIDFADFPLRRDAALPSWFLNIGTEACEKRRRDWLRDGVVPGDYPEPVAADWPDLLEVVERRVRPERAKLGENADGRKRKKFWWLYGRAPRSLYAAIAPLKRVLVNSSKATPHHALAFLPRGPVYSQNVNVFAIETYAAFAALQSRLHEVWGRFSGTTMKDDYTYTKDDCFETFPFPQGFETHAALEAAGQAYHDHRAALMVARGEGMTKTYNRFHDEGERGPDIAALRDLHAAMDRAVLQAYAANASSRDEAMGWADLAARAASVFLERPMGDNGKGHRPGAPEDDHAYQGRLFWPSAFRDEVLARLLALNAERAAEDRAMGLAPAAAAGDDESDDEEAA
jgi:hypothetical protein